MADLYYVMHIWKLFRGLVKQYLPVTRPRASTENNPQLILHGPYARALRAVTCGHQRPLAIACICRGPIGEDK